MLGLTLSTNTTELTHGLHRFPAKYIPQIPRWAIGQFAGRNDVVLDPFMGSGTTLVEGLCKVNKTFGIDIDPLARLISGAKTAQYDISNILRLSKEIDRSEPATAVPVFLPMQGVRNVEHWFRPDILADLCQIYTAIQNLRCSDIERRFFLCVFSSILRRVSNADDQTQKTYVSGTLPKIGPPVWPTYRKSLAKALAGVTALQSRRGSRIAEITDGSALEMPLPDESVGLVVTSPPYLDSVDYMYNFMLEYFWLGPLLGVSTRSEYNARRRSPVGAKRPTETRVALPSNLTELFRIDDIPQYRRDAVHSYFASMQTHFREAARVLKPDAHYVLVIGNSQVKSGVIPVHDCLLRLARNAGLHLEKAFAYRIRRHYMKFPRKGRGGIILMDWVISLRKTDQMLLPIDDRLPLPDVSIGRDEVAH